MEAYGLPNPLRCKNDMAKSALSVDCTIGDIQKLVHGLWRQHLPAVGMKKEVLPKVPKQKAYYIGGRKEGILHLSGFNRYFKNLLDFGFADILYRGNIFNL